MSQIVILGAGTGGMPAAHEMREKPGREHRITVVDAVNSFQFVPSKPWLAVGRRERDTIRFPIRPALEKRGKWVHPAKIAFEKYFRCKTKNGTSEPICEKYVLELLGSERLER